MYPSLSESYPVELYPSKNEVILPFLIFKHHSRYSKSKEVDLVLGEKAAGSRGWQERAGEAHSCSAVPHVGETLAWHNCSIIKQGCRPGPGEPKRLINS